MLFMQVGQRFALQPIVTPKQARVVRVVMWVVSGEEQEKSSSCCDYLMND